MLRFPPKEDTRTNVPLTPLIDIVLLLLIYFLLTSNFIEQDSLQVKLPRTEARGSISQDHLVVMIDRKGAYYLDEMKIAGDNLDRSLKAWLQVSRKKAVLIKADRQVVYDRVVRVMDLASKHGADRLMLATEPLPPERH